MDIATYDHSEALARSNLASWQTLQVFRPLLFEMSGFPTRVRHFGEVRPLLTGMHGSNRILPMQHELGGLQDEDLGKIVAAVTRYLDWFQSQFGDDIVPLPMADILAGYLAYTKLTGIVCGRVLEVGPGYGCLALFLCDDPTVRSYDMIEITQALYVIQSGLCSHTYGKAFRNHALAPIFEGDQGRLAAWPDGARPSFVRLKREFRCSLYPWWQTHLPMAQQYDVVMSNANLAEFSPEALQYYLRRWKDALSEAGYLIVQDIGSNLHTSVDRVLKALDEHGYRALVKCVGNTDGKYFFLWNLMLVTPAHPDYSTARSVLEPMVLVADNAAVRKVYGLDRPKGRRMTAAEIYAQVPRPG